MLLRLCTLWKEKKTKPDDNIRTSKLHPLLSVESKHSAECAISV